MEFGGRYLLGAGRAAVWAALNDAAVLQAVIPGCERIEWTGADALELRLRVDFGVIHMAFAGDLLLTNIIPARSYTLSGRGRGGLFVLAQGEADIALADADGGTLLSFTAAGKADGGIMRVGKALVGKSAQKVIDGFFHAIGREIGATVTPLPAA